MIVGGVAMGLVILYARMTRDDPKRQLLYAYILGRRQFTAGDYEAALTNFRDMEDTDFSPPAVLRGIGLSSYHLGQWVDAVTYLEDVPGRTPEEDSVLAQALVELGELDEALAVLGGMERETPEAQVVQAVIRLKQGRAAEAADGLRRVIDEGGGDHAPWEEPYLGARYWLGVALGKAGNEESAREVLSELYEIAPSYQDLAERLGRPD
jgi:tetratricopeptide (TPR) repeat protein